MKGILKESDKLEIVKEAVASLEDKDTSLTLGLLQFVLAEEETQYDKKISDFMQDMITNAGRARNVKDSQRGNSGKYLITTAKYAMFALKTMLEQTLTEFDDDKNKQVANSVIKKINEALQALDGIELGNML